MTFAVTTALRAQPPKRRAQLLKALGCTRVDKASIELAVVNRFWPAADEQPARKLGQNRNSVHALALQEAYRRSVLPEDLVERWSKKGASPEAWAASYRRRKQVGSGGGLSEGRAKPAKRASDSKRVSDIPNKPSSKLTRAKAPTLKLKGTKSTAPVNVNCSNQMIRCIQKASRCIIIVEKGKKDGVIRALEIATLHGSPNSKRSSRTKT